MPAPESKIPPQEKEAIYKSPNKPSISLPLSLLLAAVVLPVVIAVFIPLIIYKGIVVFLARRYRKDLKELLTGYDSIFAVDKYYTQPYAANATLFTVDGNIDIETVRAGFKRNVLDVTIGDKYKYLRMRQIPVVFWGHFFWKDVHIDPNRHIRKIHDFRLSEDYMDDINSHEDELQRIVGDIMTAPLPNESALWELLLLNGYRGNQSVLIFRLHHTLGDGYTFNHLVDRMIEKESPYMVKPQTIRTVKDEVSLLVRTPQLLSTLYTDGFRRKDYYTQRKQNSTGVMSMTTLPLSAMKTIRRATKTHFATVGMCLMTGALRRYFVDHQKDLSKLPNFVSIMHSLPKPNHPLSTQMCNHWGVGLFKMPLKAASSALDRLYKSEKSFGEYMQSQFEQLLHNHMPLFRLFPYFVLKIFFATNFGTGMGFTSIPAYEKQTDLWGHRVLGLWKVFGLQWRQSACAAAVYTHNGKVGYSIYANKDIFPDQRSIDLVTKHYLHLELQELLSHFSNESTGLSEKNENMNLAFRNGNGIIRTEGFA